METIYLKDGRMADLVTKTEKGYLVDPYITWNDYEGQVESAPSGQVELVGEIFATAPVELIEAEYKKVLDRVTEQQKAWAEKQAEFLKLDSQVSALRKEKTNLERVIINREELRKAKRIICWPENEIAPRILDGQRHDKLAITFEITQYKDEERAWCYRVSFKEDRFDFSEKVDTAYGIKVDLTDEEILALTLERLERFRKDKKDLRYYLQRTPDQWLSQECIEEKKSYKEKERRTELENAKKDLEALQKKIESLQAKELVLS